MSHLVFGPPSPWVEAVGWMLLHSLWQGAGVAVALAVALRVLSRASSTGRYLTACAAMIVIVAMPMMTLLRPDPSHRPHAERRDAALETAIARGMTSTAKEPISVPESAEVRIADRVGPMLPAVVASWLVGVGVFSSRLLGGWLQARSWATHQIRPLADPWTERVERIKERLGLRRAVALLDSARVEVPMVIGWIRPAILVPVAALSGLSAPDLEAILAHELAHVRRHDYLVNLIQCVVEVLMFYHPAAWWISHVIRLEREACCDDLAVAACGDRLTYARALAAMEGLRAPAFSPSPAANGGILLTRVRRILEPQEESMSPVRILAGLALVIFVTSLWLARAGGDRPAPAGPVGGSPPPTRSHTHIVSAIEEAQAEKTFVVGMYYKKAAKVASAEYYLGKIPQRWPNSPWALKAKTELVELAKMPRPPSQSIRFPEGPISEILFEGNVTIPPEKIRTKLLSRAGQPFDPRKIDADVKSLMKSNRFSQVDAYFDESPPKSGKSVLIFSVREMPKLTHVEFRGRKAIRLEEIEETTGLKVGNRADPMRTRNAVHSIYRLYKEKGYDLAEVELIEGGNAGDTRVVIQIFEGPKVTIGRIDFVGCRFVTPAVLRTHITTPGPVPSPIAPYRDGLLEDDRQKLVDYYQGLGFIEAKVTPVTRAGERPGEIDLTFVISEGPRYTVGKVIVEGNTRIKTDTLMADMELRPGRPYVLAVREADKRRILARYGGIGCVDAEVDVEPRFTSQAGSVDLLYRIDEGEPYLLGELMIRGNDRTKDRVIRREGVQAEMLPDAALDGPQVDLYKWWLMMLGDSSHGPENPEKPIQVEIKRRRPPDHPATR